MERKPLGRYKLVDKDQEPPKGYKSNLTPIQDFPWGTDVNIYVFPKYDRQDKYPFYIDDDYTHAFTDQIFVDKDGINQALNKVDQQYRENNPGWEEKEEERRQEQRRRQEEERRQEKPAAEEAANPMSPIDYKEKYEGKQIKFKTIAEPLAEKTGYVIGVGKIKNTDKIKLQVRDGMSILTIVPEEVTKIISSGGMRKTKNKRRKQKRKTKRSKRRNNKSNKRKTKRSKRRNNK